MQHDLLCEAAWNGSQWVRDISSAEISGPDTAIFGLAVTSGADDPAIKCDRGAKSFTRLYGRRFWVFEGSEEFDQMRGLRGGPIEADRIQHRAAEAQNAVGGCEEGEDRRVFCYVVGVERGVQYLQQEGFECVPVPLVDLYSVSRLWVFDYVDLLGYQDCRGS